MAPTSHFGSVDKNFVREGLANKTGLKQWGRRCKFGGRNTRREEQQFPGMGRIRGN